MLVSQVGLRPDLATAQSLRQTTVSVPWLPYLQNGVYSSSSSLIVRCLDRSIHAMLLEECLVHQGSAFNY